ncbi:GNAT family N-acetyltransferase [Halopiger djelfimassiliensis]|uniref:GNAT family N-acetyltransferase n=1 Tax=Halopiger djelfimassiliensis TaxID=1293047 RepID=UPI000677B50E|nr:GNAT family N-acetyltransferase [Halopiger djelfimassiliensis]
MNIRRATHDDREAVIEFTSEIWTDRGGDYIPEIYDEWIEDDTEYGKKTFLAEIDGNAAGIVQAVMLTPDEAWFQGIRVAPDYRRRGVSQRLIEACFEWARDRGATTGRVMIFSWNTASLGSARAGGFEPVSEFRFVHPDPDHRAEIPASWTVSNDPAAAWRYWTHCDAREQLCGLGLAPEESWAIRELTREDFHAFADETAVFAVEGDDGLAGAAYRTRTGERSIIEDETNDDEATEAYAEYGLAAWDDDTAARALFAAIARDAASLEVDRTRVLVPERARYVTDAAAVGAEIADEPDFVLAADLTRSVP